MSKMPCPDTGDQCPSCDGYYTHRYHREAVEAERDRLIADHDIAVKQFWKEIDRLKAELDLIKRNMKKTWPECEIMDEVIRERDAWKSKAETYESDLQIYREKIGELLQECVIQNDKLCHWQEKANKLAEAGKRWVAHQESTGCREPECGDMRQFKEALAEFEKGK